MENNLLKNNRRYSFFSQIIKLITQFAGGILIAKIIGPKSFGVYAASMTVMNFMYIIKDFGFGAAVINKDINKNDASFIWCLNVFFGLALSFLLFIFSDKFAEFLGMSEAGIVLRTMAPVFFIQSIYLINISFMEKNNEFKKIYIIESLATIFGFVTALIFVLSGFHYFGIAIQSVATSILILIGATFFGGWRPTRFKINKSAFAYISYGISVFYSNSINYLTRNMDSYYVGINMGQKILGIYGMAYKIMFMPMQNISQVIARAAFPVMSDRYRNNIEIESIYKKNISIIFYIAMPFMAMIFSFRYHIVENIFNPDWADMSNYIFYLVPIGLLQTVLSSTGCVYMAIGKTKVMTALSFVGFLLQAPVFIYSSRKGINFFLISLLIANAFNFLISIAVFIGTTKFSLRCFSVAIKPTFICLVFVVVQKHCIDYLFGENYFSLFFEAISSIFVLYYCINCVKGDL